MNCFRVVLGIWLASLAGVAGQSASPPPVFIVRLDPASALPTGAGRQAATMVPDPAAMRPAPGPVGQLQPLSVTRLDDSGAAAVLDAPRALSLRFSAPQPVRQVLMLLVRDTGLSLVVSPDADGTFAGELAGVTLRQALELVLAPQRLDYRVEGNAISVFARATETRILDVNAVAARREGNSTGDTFDELAKSLGALLSPAGRVGVDRKAGLAHVTDYPERIARVAAYIESLERRLGRQVSIQARVIELVLPDAHAPAVNWSQVIAESRSGEATRGEVDFGRLLSALSARGTVRVVTTAGLQALHNERAVVRIGAQAPPFEGFSLAVTPSIGTDGTILMTVEPTVSQADADPRTGAASPVPGTVEASTAVRVRDGETLVLPGIRRARSEIAVLLTTKVI